MESTAAIAVITALLYLVGYLYEWHHVKEMGLPPELFGVSFEDYLVRGAITAATCFTQRKKRLVYMIPAIGVGIYATAQLWIGNFSALSVAVNVLVFFIALWLLLKGPPEFAAEDAQNRGILTQNDCYRVVNLHFVGGGTATGNLLRSTDKHIAIHDIHSAEVRVFRTESVEKLEMTNEFLKARELKKAPKHIPEAPDPKAV